MTAASDKDFKILSIDGGGIKGLYSATILRHFEEQYNCRISDHFDMLCGTSTGGLIALALSLRMPAADICRFYEEEGPNIFPQFIFNKRWLPKKVVNWINAGVGIAKQTFYKGKFDDVPLRKALEKIFKERTLSESHNLLCIPTYVVTEARPWVFKFDHKEGNLDRDNKAKYVDVALATSAAPTYFPMAEIDYYDRKQFVDGGVWGNNPTLVGFLEALTYFVGQGKPYQSLKILSVSSLTLTGGKPVGIKRKRAFVNWRNELFETSLTGQSYFTDYFMEKIKSINDVAVDYVRIPYPLVSHEQAHLVQLDVATPDALDMLRGKGNDQGELYRKRADVATFFQTTKHYQTH